MSILLALLLLQAAPAACPTPAPVPAELTGWRSPVAVASGGAVAVGKAARVALVPDVRFAMPPERAAKPGTRGARLDFTVSTAGNYRVALDSGVWIDVVRDGRAIASATHGHGPACSGVRKQVDFALTPGRYVLQLSGAAGPAATVMVARIG